MVLGAKSNQGDYQQGAAASEKGEHLHSSRESSVQILSPQGPAVRKHGSIKPKSNLLRTN